MTGTISWMNPYGFLPGELYYFIPLFGYLAVAYVVLSVIWVVVCFVNRHQLIQLHHYVTFAICLGILETVTWYFDYRNFNETGLRPITPVIAGVVISSFKRTLSRILVLVVCMGYGIMKANLTTWQWRKIGLLGVVSFTFSSIHDVVLSYGQMTSTLERRGVFFVFPVAAIDSIFFLWILQEISTNITELSERKQIAKLRVYRQFWQLLFAAGVFSVLWALYQIVMTFGSDEDGRWDSLWTYEGMWHIIYFVVLVAVAILWRPNPNTKAYVYMDQVGTDDTHDGEFTQSVVRPVSKAIAPAFGSAGSDHSDDGNDDDFEDVK
eukprot:c3770_g1_i1.p1 GENE.c3770_g1_i1~~c3770_g1_i1.p1  ORF type:complete len:322 (+),score=71.21 c3770_g1_i1:612-1577(+)